MNLAPEQLSEILPDLTPEELSALSADRELSLLYERRTDTGQTTTRRLAPAFRQELIDAVGAIDPDIGVEVLFLEPWPDQNDHTGLEIYHVLQAISTMAGIEYYSETNGRMRVLFYESFVVADAEDRTRLADPVAQELPESDRLYVYQRDSRFGRNVLELQYTVEGDSILVEMRNLSRMYFQGLVPAVAPEQLYLALVVRLVDGALLFYGTSAANPAALLGMQERVQQSFYNRLVALHDWFVTQLDADSS
jgi:hypothetical protein